MIIEILCLNKIKFNKFKLSITLCISFRYLKDLKIGIKLFFKFETKLIFEQKFLKKSNSYTNNP